MILTKGGTLICYASTPISSHQFVEYTSKTHIQSIVEQEDDGSVPSDERTHLTDALHIRGFSTSCYVFWINWLKA
jgi:hypothetical protein